MRRLLLRISAWKCLKTIRHLSYIFVESCTLIIQNVSNNRLCDVIQGNGAFHLVARLYNVRGKSLTMGEEVGEHNMNQIYNITSSANISVSVTSDRFSQVMVVDNNSHDLTLFKSFVLIKKLHSARLISQESTAILAAPWCCNQTQQGFYLCFYEIPRAECTFLYKMSWQSNQQLSGSQTCLYLTTKFCFVFGFSF